MSKKKRGWGPSINIHIFTSIQSIHLIRRLTLKSVHINIYSNPQIAMKMIEIRLKVLKVHRKQHYLFCHILLPPSKSMYALYTEGLFRKHYWGDEAFQLSPAKSGPSSFQGLPESWSTPPPSIGSIWVSPTYYNVLITPLYVFYGPI